MATFGLHGRLQAIAQGGGPQFPPPNVRSVLAAPEICVSSWLASRRPSSHCTGSGRNYKKAPRSNREVLDGTLATVLNPMIRPSNAAPKEQSRCFILLGGYDCLSNLPKDHANGKPICPKTNECTEAICKSHRKRSLNIQLQTWAPQRFSMLQRSSSNHHRPSSSSSTAQASWPCLRARADGRWAPYHRSAASQVEGPEIQRHVMRAEIVRALNYP